MARRLTRETPEKLPLQEAIPIIAFPIILLSRPPQHKSNTLLKLSSILQFRLICRHSARDCLDRPGVSALGTPKKHPLCTELPAHDPTEYAY